MNYTQTSDLNFPMSISNEAIIKISKSVGIKDNFFNENLVVSKVEINSILAIQLNFKKKISKIQKASWFCVQKIKKFRLILVPDFQGMFVFQDH